MRFLKYHRILVLQR